MSVHGHQRSDSGGRPQLQAALAVTLGIMFVEGVAGWWTGSLALLADAGHMLTDAGALTLSLFAACLAARPATPEKTYGYYRTEILAALANGVTLWLIVIWIDVSAVYRLRHPVSVQTGPMIAVAVLGLLANLLSGFLLREQRVGNLNVQGAWLNVMSDALGSLGVLIAGTVIHVFGWTAADPIASIVISLLIAVNSWNLIKQSVNILLEGTPRHLRIAEVVQAMQGVPGVCDVHDLHLWTITTGMDAMSGHVIIAEVAMSERILEQLNQVLSERFGIAHTTFQLEPRQRAESPG